MKMRRNIVTGIVLILVGALALTYQIFPQLQDYFYIEFGWPLIVIGVGVLLALIGLFTWEAGMVVPACIVGGIGGLLYYQNATGDWGSWAYAWALIPGFVGVGTLLLGLLTRDRGTMGGGGWLIFISLTLFAIFGSFLGPPIAILKYWPLLLIVLGLLLLARGVFRRR